MNSTELNTFLTKSTCCAGNKTKQVADMLLQGDKCATKEFKNLVVLISALEALECYIAPLEDTVCTPVEVGGTPVNGSFTISIPCAINIPMDGHVIFRGSDSTDISYTVTDPMGEDLIFIFETYIVASLPAGYTVVLSSGDCAGGLPQVYTITTPCDVTNVNLNYNYIDGEATISVNIAGNLVTAGVCPETSIQCTTTTTEYTNCLTATEADNLVNIITKICDSCNCD